MNSARCGISPEFLVCEGRQLFTLTLQPERLAARGAVLFVPAFAEEMNKSRHTVVEATRTLAAAGYIVMLLDPSGCGDSGGDFANARWGDWKADASFAIDYLARRYEVPVTLWGLRLGALLAAELAGDTATKLEHLLLWQPVLNGEQHIDHFLRFELAGQVLRGNLGFDRASLWNELRGGRSLQVAGYELSSQLALEIAHVRLANLQPRCPVTWLDIMKPPVQEPGVANANVIGLWRERGVAVAWRCAEGEAFWRNVDAPDSPLLAAATRDAMAGS